MISVSHPPYAHHLLHNNNNQHHQNRQHHQHQHQHQQARDSTHHARSTGQPFDFGPTTTSFGLESINSLAAGTLPNAPMSGENWGSIAQYNPDKLGRLPHQRESSLSSMGSAGPASPYNQSTSNPQIAITDSTGDDLSDMHAQDPSNQNGQFYHLSKSVGNPYTGYQNLDQTMPEMAYPVTIPGPSNKPRSDRGLLPAPELSGSSRSHPTSVASSIAGDSPATPTVGADDGSDRRRKDGYGNVPKLDRTMTDVYGDELYSPNFAITSTPQSQPQQLSTISPPNDIFNQRLNAANSQHLNVGHSPASTTVRDESSPFRPNSPFAKSNQDFAAPNDRPLNTAQRMREQNKVQQDAHMFRPQMTHGVDPETPKTISPKDAILEFNEPEGGNDFPLFPQHSVNLNMDQLAKVMPQQAHAQSFMPGMPGAPIDQFNYMSAPPMASGLQVPQQYPFIPRMQPSSNASPPRLSSSGSSSDSGGNTPANMVRPLGTGADSGTYTCTYHGCTLRFETPALLQKHKREGHRQTHGLTPARPDIGMTSNVLNSQAGPHRCDRINPSTGKPCSTVFSRPYDLTRHEDTIHNARKQKVRCDVCTEEKTFSRADALTRHYRVCHPEMELPGKLRRRGGV